MAFQWLVVKSFQHFLFIYARQSYLLKVYTAQLLLLLLLLLLLVLLLLLLFF